MVRLYALTVDMVNAILLRMEKDISVQVKSATKGLKQHG